MRYVFYLIFFQMKTKIDFTDEAISELAEFEKIVKHPKLLLRINVIQMIACWIPNNTIQKVKSISHDSVRRYSKLYKKWWIKGLLERNCEWRVGRLSEEQKQEIKGIGEKKGFKIGKEAQNIIKEMFGVSYKIRQVQRLLKKWDLPTKKQKKYLENAQV